MTYFTHPLPKYENNLWNEKELKWELTKLLPSIAKKIEQTITSWRKFNHRDLSLDQIPDNAILGNAYAQKQKNIEILLDHLSFFEKKLDTKYSKKYPLVLAIDTCFTNETIKWISTKLLGKDLNRYMVNVPMVYDLQMDDQNLGKHLHKDALLISWWSQLDVPSLKEEYYSSILCKMMRNIAIDNSTKNNMRLLAICFSHQLFTNNLWLLRYDTPNIAVTIKWPTQTTLSSYQVLNLEHEHPVYQKALYPLSWTTKWWWKVSIASTRTWYAYYDLLWEWDINHAKNMWIIPLIIDQMTNMIVAVGVPNGRVLSLQPHPEIDIIDTSFVNEQIWYMFKSLTSNFDSKDKIKFNTWEPLYLSIIVSFLEDMRKQYEWSYKTQNLFLDENNDQVNENNDILLWKIDKINRLKLISIDQSPQMDINETSQILWVNNLTSLLDNHYNFLKEEPQSKSQNFVFREWWTLSWICTWELKKHYKLSWKQIKFYWVSDSIYIDFYKVLKESLFPEKFADKMVNYFSRLFGEAKKGSVKAWQVLNWDWAYDKVLEIINDWKYDISVIEQLTDRIEKHVKSNITEQSIMFFIVNVFVNKLLKQIKINPWQKLIDAIDEQIDLIKFWGKEKTYFNSLTWNYRFMYKDFSGFNVPYFFRLFMQLSIWVELWDEIKNDIKTNTYKYFSWNLEDIIIWDYNGIEIEKPLNNVHMQIMCKSSSHMCSIEYKQTICKFLNDAAQWALCLDSGITQAYTWNIRIEELYNIKKKFWNNISIKLLFDMAQNVFISSIIEKYPYNPDTENYLDKWYTIIDIDDAYHCPYFRLQSIVRRYLSSNFKYNELFERTDISARISTVIWNLLDNLLENVWVGEHFWDRNPNFYLKSEWKQYCLLFWNNDSIFLDHDKDKLIEEFATNFRDQIVFLINKTAIKLNTISMVNAALKIYNKKLQDNLVWIELVQEIWLSERKIFKNIDKFFEDKSILVDISWHSLKFTDLNYNSGLNDIHSFVMNFDFLKWVITNTLNISSQDFTEFKAILKSLNYADFETYNTITWEQFDIFCNSIWDSTEKILNWNMFLPWGFDLYAQPIEQKFRDLISESLPKDIKKELVAALIKDPKNVLNDIWLQKIENSVEKELSTSQKLKLLELEKELWEDSWFY